MGIIWIIIVGFVAGIVARLLAPGPNKPTGFVLTTVLGIAGAFLRRSSARPSAGIAPIKARDLSARSSAHLLFCSSGIGWLPRAPSGIRESGKARHRGGSHAGRLRSMRHALGESYDG
jgi:hypothetical protein